MISFTPLFVTLLSIAAFAFIFFLVLGKIFFVGELNEKLSFWHHFPYELVSQNKSKFTPVYRIFLYLYTGLCVTPLILLLTCSTNLYQSLFTYTIVIIAVFILNQFIFIGLSMIPAKFVKSHLTLFTIYSCLTLLVSACLAVLSFIFTFKGEFCAYHLILGIISIVLTLGAVVITLNPKLSKWANLSRENNEDGTSTLVRPKHFVLAYSEWFLFFINFVSLILFSLILLNV